MSSYNYAYTSLFEIVFKKACTRCFPVTKCPYFNSKHYIIKIRQSSWRNFYIMTSLRWTPFIYMYIFLIWFHFNKSIPNLIFKVIYRTWGGGGVTLHSGNSFVRFNFHLGSTSQAKSKSSYLCISLLYCLNESH